MRRETYKNLCAVSALPQEFTAADTRESLGWSKEKARTTLNRMEQMGYISFDTRMAESIRGCRQPIKHWKLTDLGLEEMGSYKEPVREPRGIVAARKSAPRLVANSVFQWGQI